jgi:hypothetical protein
VGLGCIGNVDQGLEFGIEMGGFGQEDCIHRELGDCIHRELGDCIHRELGDCIHRELGDCIHQELGDCIHRDLEVKCLGLGSCSLGICLVPGFGLGVGRLDCSLHRILMASAIHVGECEGTRVGHLGRQWERVESGSLTWEVDHLPCRSCYLASVRKGCTMTLILKLKFNF